MRNTASGLQVVNIKMFNYWGKLLRLFLCSSVLWQLSVKKKSRCKTATARKGVNEKLEQNAEVKAKTVLSCYERPRSEVKTTGADMTIHHLNMWIMATVLIYMHKNVSFSPRYTLASRCEKWV